VGSSSGRHGFVGSSSYNTVAARIIKQYVYYHIPIRSYSLKDDPEDGPMRSEKL
jgi:hypothetical protein